MYKVLNKIENLLQNEKVTGYKIEVYTNKKNYTIEVPENEYTITHAIGFEIPSKNEYEE